MKKQLAIVFASVLLSSAPSWAEPIVRPVAPQPGSEVPLPVEPTAAGRTDINPTPPHGQAVREARQQYAADKLMCREATMSTQEFRDCRKAAKQERNERIQDSPAQPLVAP